VALRQQLREASLLDFLPVRDVESDVIWSPTGHVTLLYELEAHHEPGLTDEECNTKARQADNAWNAMPEEMVYQFLVVADSRKGREAVEKAWPPIAVDDETGRILEAYRSARMKELLREDPTTGGLDLVLERRHFFAATFLPKAINPSWFDNPLGKTAQILGMVPRASLRESPIGVHKRILTEIATANRRVQSGLWQMGLTFRQCKNEDIVSFLYQLLNPDASCATDLRELPLRPVLLRGGSEDPRRSGDEREIRANAPWAADYSPLHVLADDDHQVEWNYLRIGSKCAGIITLKELPKEVEPGTLVPLVSLGRRRFVISYRINKPRKAPTVRRLRRKGMLAHGLSVHNYFVETDHKDVQMSEIAKQVETALHRIYAMGECVFGVTLQILVYEDDRERLDEACAEVLGVMASANGLHGYREAPGLFDAYLGMVPGGLAVERECELMTREMVDLMPVFDVGQWKGMVPFRTSRNTCTWVDQFDTTICPNANAFIIGASGSGKSYLGNTLLLSYRIAAAARGLEPPCMYIIDCGGSYDRAMRILPDGVSRTFTPDSVPGIDPFVFDGDEPLEDHITALAWLLLDLYQIEEQPRERFTRLQGVLEQALPAVYGASGRRDFEGLDKALAAIGGEDAELLRRSAARFRSGSLARLFRPDPKTALADDVRAVAYDFAGLQGQADQAAIALRLVVFEIRRRTARLHRKRIRSLVLFDESWMLLNSESGQKNVVSAAGPFIAEYVRTARKVGGGVLALSQQLTDFMRCPWGPAIVSNSATKFIGATGGETEVMDLKQYLGITDRQVKQIQGLRTKPREFLLIQGGAGGGGRTEVVQVTSDPLSLWTFGTSPAERQRMAAIAAAHPELSVFDQIQLLAGGR
jgi:hypothetical protein